MESFSSFSALEEVAFFEAVVLKVEVGAFPFGANHGEKSGKVRGRVQKTERRDQSSVYRLLDVTASRLTHVG
jgi:hypothetical protein